MRNVCVGVLVVVFNVTAFAAVLDVENKPILKPTTTSPVELDQTVRFTVDVIEATLDKSSLTIDYQKIDPGKHRVGKILESLKKSGEVSVTYRYDNPVMMRKQVTLSSGQRQPFVTGQNLGKNGHVTSTIQYERVGVNGRFMLKEPNEGEYQLEGNAEWSGMGESGIEIAESIKAPISMKIKIDIFSTLKLDVPVLLSSTMKLSEKEKGVPQIKTVIYRIMISPVEEENPGQFPR